MRIGIDARKIADYGIGTYIRGLLRGLVELGGGDTYVAFAPRNAPLPEGVEHVAVDAPHYSVRELFAVGRAADRARLDLFHAPHYVVPFTRVPVIVTVHDLIHLHQPLRNPLAPLYARTMIGRALRKAVRVLTVSNAVRRDLVATFAADPARIFVTPNGIDDIFLGRGPAAGGDYFLYVGNDKPHKNVETLVEAFARLNRDDVTLVLVGAPFARFADRKNVVRAGFVTIEELAALYRGAMAVVVPSSEEGFGLPAVEAMACGAPVITSTAAALVEVTGDAAMHVATADAAALADAMQRIVTSVTLRSTLAARGRERAREFTWQRCAQLTRRAYEA